MTFKWWLLLSRRAGSLEAMFQSLDMLYTLSIHFKIICTYLFRCTQAYSYIIYCILPCLRDQLTCLNLITSKNPGFKVMATQHQRWGSYIKLLIKYWQRQENGWRIPFFRDYTGGHGNLTLTPTTSLGDPGAVLRSGFLFRSHASTSLPTLATRRAGGPDAVVRDVAQVLHPSVNNLPLGSYRH